MDVRGKEARRGEVGIDFTGRIEIDGVKGLGGFIFEAFHMTWHLSCLIIETLYQFPQLIPMKTYCYSGVGGA